MKSLYERMTECLEFQYGKLDESYKKEFNYNVNEFIETHMFENSHSNLEVVEKISSEIDEMFEELLEEVRGEIRTAIEYERWTHE